jgi:hypothetical protein
MLLDPSSQKETKISHSIQLLIAKLILYFIDLMGNSPDDDLEDKREMRIKLKNAWKYLKFCQAILSEESFIEQDEDFEQFLFYFMNCTIMCTDMQIRFELQEYIVAVAKDLDMDGLDRFLEDDIEEEDWIDLMQNLAFAIIGDEIDECNSTYHMIIQKMMIDDTSRQGKLVISLCNRIIDQYENNTMIETTDN